MSRRLLQKGRYPKAPAVEQITSTSSAFSSQPITQCPGVAEIPTYASPQPQPSNVWSQPNYTNPSSYQHPHVSDTSNYWSPGPTYASPMQPMQQPSDPWNWPGENNVPSANQPQPQNQEPVYKQQNLNYQQQNSPYQQPYVQPQLQPDTNYQHLNSNYQQQQQPAPGYQPADPAYQQPVYQHQQFDPNYQHFQPGNAVSQAQPQVDLRHQQPQSMYSPNQPQVNPNSHIPSQSGFNYPQQQEQVLNYQQQPQQSVSEAFGLSDIGQQHRQVKSAAIDGGTLPQVSSESSLICDVQKNNIMNSIQPSTEQYVNQTKNSLTNYDGWDEATLSITEPAELPWTYGSPQYSNPMTTSAAEFPGTSAPSNVPVSLNSTESAAPSSLGYLPTDSNKLNCTANDTCHESQDYAITGSKDDSDSSNAIDFDASSIVRDLAVDADYESNSLSAFFQNSDFNNSCNNSDYGAASTPDIKHALDSSSLEENLAHLHLNDERSSVPTEDEQDEQNLENMDDLGNQEANLLPEDNVDLSIDVKEESVEEPINQEVPEPSKKEAQNHASQIVQGNQDFHKVSPEEPFNQQIPVRSEDKPRSTSSERVVIQPREGSPFKPPKINGTYKGTVVQQETPIIKTVEQKPPETKTVAQEVNLETVPDNLERPPDYAELQKQSSFYASHKKHLRTELNSSPSSLLCDKPDIPCVTLAPAAPPIHSSAKSDQSESSNDSRPGKHKSEKSAAYRNSKKESNTSSPAYGDSEPSEKSLSSEMSYPASSKEAQEHKPSPSSSKPSVHNPQQAELKNEANDRNSSKHIKESRIREVRHPDDYPRQVASMENVEEPNYSSDYSSRHSEYSLSKPRHDPRYAPHDPDYGRQRFADKKYPSFDDHQYYSDRERSRPPSRSSLDERSEDYRYSNKARDPRDYPYVPRDDRRHGHPDANRTPSRMSESDMRRPDRQGQYDYYKQPYPYSGNYPKNNDYYPKAPGYRGYDYDPYQRDPYYASYYDAYRQAYSSYNYGYYDELYRNDPRYRQYQDHYRQYYAKYGYEGDFERSSAHSGRSSANELAKDLSASQYPDPDESSNASEISAYNMRQEYSYDEMPNDVSVSVLATDRSSSSSARLTPAKFPYGHPIARFCPGGLLITAIPSNVDSTMSASVRIQTMQGIMENEDSYQELKNYQGPLIRGSTHKNDVIDFCNQKIKTLRTKEDVVDRDSHILLWELEILMLRQNGSVVGSDIAELLLKDHEVLRPHGAPLRNIIETPQSEQSPADVNDSSSQSHAGDASSPDEGIVVLHDKSSLNPPKTVDVEKVTRKFREFLLFGHKKDALEWAIKHGLWGHALFLASKMDLRTYASVMTRFANSLALNDPLQTLYQLMSGRQPSAVTCVADKKWGDWRPHLAMILSNPSGMPEVDSRSITTLGDTLASRGCLPAAHFCYVMAQVEFGTFEDKSSKLVLLCADHRLPFEEFATNEAIQCTEIYEYAQSLANPAYSLIHLQMYKFIYALRLVEHGFLEEALHYCEDIARRLLIHPVLYSYELIYEVFKLASQLKYHDPHFFRGHGEFEDQEDPEWIINLENLVQNYNNLSTEQNSQTQCESISESTPQATEHASPPTEIFQFQNGSQPSMQYEMQSEMPNSVNTNYYQSTSPVSNNGFMSSSQTEMPTYYQPDQQQQQQNQQQHYTNQNAFQFESSLPSHEENETTDVPSSPVTQTPPFDYYSNSTNQEWSSVHSVPSVTHSDVVSGQSFSRPDHERLLQKEEVDSDIALCSSAHSTPLHNYLLSKDYSDDRQMLMTSCSADARSLNSCLKSKHALHSAKSKKCIKFDASVSGHQGKLQRSGIRRRKFSKKRSETASQSESSPEGSPSKEKHKSKLSLLASLGILRSDTKSQKLTKRKKKAKKKNETLEKLMQSKKTFAIDEPCDTDEVQMHNLENKRLVGILKKISNDKKNSELGQLMSNEFNKKPPLIFGGTYPIDEPFESKPCSYNSKSSKAFNVKDKFSDISKKGRNPNLRKKPQNAPSKHTKAKDLSFSVKPASSLEEKFCKMSPLKLLQQVHKKTILSRSDLQSTNISSSDLHDNHLKCSKVPDYTHSSYDQFGNYNSATTRRERRDSAMSSASRYSAGSLPAARQSTVKEATKTESKAEAKPSSQAGKTWLGGIFSRLLPKGPNQMILPDDKNPTIVWDETNKCWVNKDSNDEDEVNAPLAPPTDSELMGSQSSEKPSVPPSNSMPPVASSPVNKFQRPKTKGMRQNYVDVLNNSGATTKTNIPPDALFPSPFEQPSATMFIPQPVSNPGEGADPESTNSFDNPSMETQEQSQALSAPLMFDPAEFDARGSNTLNQRQRTIGRTGRRTYPT